MDSKKKYKGDISESKNKGSALHINNGTDQLPQINPNRGSVKRKAKKELSVKEYVKEIKAGNINVLSRAITLVESTLPAHYDLSQKIIESCISSSGKSIRIGITGVPGVGKSTFIESLGMDVVNRGKKLAVLAVDPSSSRSGGSILGDKTRMEQLSAAKNAFIRPSPSAGSLGGVARKTHEIIILCEAAGFDTIFIETVGVGQSETTVKNMVDFFLLLMLSGAGDELQGIKRGIMEMADAIAITKSDGDNIKKAEIAKSQYQSALHLFPPSKSGWTPKVLTCSALENKGISELWDNINEYKKHTQKNGFFNKNRKEQAKFWMYETINLQLKQRFYSNNEIKAKIEEYEKNVLEGKVSSFIAANNLLEKYHKSQ